MAVRKVSRTVQFDSETDGRLDRIAMLRKVPYAVIVREIVERHIAPYEREEMARMLRHQEPAEMVEVPA